MYQVIVHNADVPLAYCTSKVAAERFRDAYLRTSLDKPDVRIVWMPNKDTVTWRSFQP